MTIDMGISCDKNHESESDDDFDVMGFRSEREFIVTYAAVNVVICK